MDLGEISRDKEEECRSSRLGEPRDMCVRNEQDEPGSVKWVIWLT